MFTQRSHEKEWLDLGPAYYSAEEYRHCQKMLFRINKLLGFFRGTQKILKRFSKTSSLLDIGCGGGLFLLHLSQCFPHLQLRGIDISSEAIALAEEELQTWKKLKRCEKVSFNLQTLPDWGIPANSVDLVLSTLVCHHLSDEDLVVFLQKTQLIAREAVIINDLHRHPLAYAFYSLFSPLLFRNRLITHDGLLSIRRGFTRHEWQGYLKKAGIRHYQIKWCFPFRWRVILWKK
jgi:2-polyprenyl-3-methyl-5-hydroxy-6-metoxy-1,4-benzoquinol methylase